MEKIKVLWLDQDIKEDLIEAREERYRRYYPNARIEFVNSLGGLKRLADGDKLGSFEVIIAHMSFEGLSDFMYGNRDGMFWSRIGIVTDEIIRKGLTRDAINRFSPDFLSDYSDTEFINSQIERRGITLPETKWRGKKVLTSVTCFDPEGRLISRERE